MKPINQAADSSLIEPINSNFDVSILQEINKRQSYQPQYINISPAVTASPSAVSP